MEEGSSNHSQPVFFFFFFFRSGDHLATPRRRHVVNQCLEFGRDTENSNSNSKTLFYKDCSLGLGKNLSNN